MKRGGQPAFAARLVARDWRSGELRLLVVAVMLAVAALTAVAFLTDRVGQAVSLRVAESLAADLRLASARPLPETYVAEAEARGLEVARLVSTPSVALSGDRQTLAAVRAADEGYPLRGRLKVASELLGDEVETDDIPRPGTAWAASRLLTRLDAQVGDVLEVGAARLTVERVLTFRPDQGLQFVDLAPTLLIHVDDLATTELVQPGSRVRYRLLFAGDNDDITDFQQWLEPRLAAGEELSDITDSAPQIRSATDRAGRFLNLAALVSVLLAAVAVAMAARRYARRHRDRIALMKCLGAPRATLFSLSLWQLGVLAVGSTVIGSALGYAAQAGLAWLLRDLIGGALPAPGWAPVGLGAVTALMILTGFALPDLLQMARTPPMRVLRADVEPPPWRFGLAWVVGILSVLGLLAWMVRDGPLVLSVFGALAALFAVLAACGWLLVRILGRFRGRGASAWQFGLASISRRGRDSVVQLVAFGLGIMVLLLLTLVRTELMTAWQQSLPEDAPNQFLINIQPDDIDAMQTFMRERGLQVPEFVPLVRARMTAINGQDVTQIRFEDPEGDRWADRDANLSWSETLSPDNRLVAGEWWRDDVSQPQASLEQEFAAELGVGVGDRVHFDVAGEPLVATVTSLREVNWDSFQPNFFMVLSPGSLDGYPASYIASLRVRDGDAPAWLDLMRTFPEITAIDLDAIIAQVRDVMDKASLAVQAIFLFTLLTGLTVLWAAVLSTRDEREFESAMLRALGASRRRVFAGVAVEFFCLGALAGVLAASGASLAGYVVSQRLFEIDYSFSPTLWAAGLVAGTVFVGLSGLLATRRVTRVSPLRILSARA